MVENPEKPNGFADHDPVFKNGYFTGNINPFPKRSDSGFFGAQLQRQTQLDALSSLLWARLPRQHWHQFAHVLRHCGASVAQPEGRRCSVALREAAFPGGLDVAKTRHKKKKNGD